MRATPVEVSVVMPFGDHEDDIGAAARRLASYLRGHEYNFELVCVDEDSGDNSRAILQLLRDELPELRIAVADGRGRGIAAGVEVAVGRVVAIVTPVVAARKSLAALGRALRRVGRREIDAALVGDLYAVCHRTGCLTLLRAFGGHRGFGPRLVRRARSQGLRVESYELGGPSRQRPALGWAALVNRLRPGFMS